MIKLESKEDIKKLFINLGYPDNSLFNYDKKFLELEDDEVVHNMHLITKVEGFIDNLSVWLFELTEKNTENINRISKKLYRRTLDENLFIYTDTKYKDITFTYCFPGQEKIIIRRLNIENGIISRFDKEVLEKINIKNKEDVIFLEIYKNAFSIEDVTNKFFKEFKIQIDNLTKNIEGLDDKHDKRNYAVLILSRLIFLCFVQKKKWLNGKKDYLYDRFLYCKENNKDYFTEILEPLFFECLNTPPDEGFMKERSEKAKRLYENFESYTDVECDPNFAGIPFLNGGLFERHPKYEVGTNVRIKNANKVFGKIFKDLLNKYAFTIREDLGLDSEVAVDPELLGRIFENMILEKERKETGSFYTPRPVINYMCKKSIKEYLITNMGEDLRDEIEYFVDNIEESDLYAKERLMTINSVTSKKKVINGKRYMLKIPEMKKALKLLNDVKVCDPAVGSGAFILGMLQLLLILKKKLNYYIYKKNIDTYKEKRKIIKNNLYGVDIQEGAVEIAHLRLWLSLAVEHDAKCIKEVPTLPNLKYRITQGNSLISNYNDVVDFDVSIKNIKKEIPISINNHISSVKYNEGIDNIVYLKNNYFSATTDKKDIVKEIKDAEFGLVRTVLKEAKKYKSDQQVKEIMNESKEKCFSWCFNFPEIFAKDNSKEIGFDIVIGNPPYVNSKDTNKLAYKKELVEEYGFSDDLYNYFTVKSFDLLKQNGILTLITSNTFLTIQSKLNMRKLLQKKRLIELVETPKAFDALVDTVIFTVRNKKDLNNYRFNYVNARRSQIEDFYDFDKSPNIKQYKNTPIDMYRNNLLKVFFKPNKLNMQIYKKHMHKISELYNKWWDKIKTSRQIKKHSDELEKYRKQLKPGDITLLGLITEGCVGLQTGDNGRFVGVLEGTKRANKIKEQRPDRFFERILSDEKKKEKLANYYPEIRHLETKNQSRDYFESLGEHYIRSLFDKAKEVIDKNILGRGYLYRIIRPSEVADVNKLTDDEKLNGIDDKEKVYVPYDKGDEDGNRWYLETPYYINWSKESVNIYQTSKKARWQGYDYYFREGFCWTNVLNPNSKYIKARLKEAGVYDVGSMSMFSVCDKISDKYLVALINSYLMFQIERVFINNTVNLQLNDIRKFPIIIPSKSQLNYINSIVDKAIDIKKKQFLEEITETQAKEELDKIQEKVDEFIYELYEIERWGECK